MLASTASSTGCARSCPIKLRRPSRAPRSSPEGTEPAAVELTIERLASSGDGVATVDGRAVFVPSVLPGERVLARPLVDRRRAVCERVLEPARARRVPPCALASTCGGCDWMHMDEAYQATAKVEVVLGALRHLGQLDTDSLEVRPCIAAPVALGARRRAFLHLSGGRLGFLGRQSHALVALERCPALASPIAELPGRLAPQLAPVEKAVERVGILAAGGRYALALFLRGAMGAKVRATAEALLSLGAEGVVVVPGPGQGAAVVLGEPALQEAAPLAEHVRLFLRPDGFAQADAGQNRELVGAALRLLQPTSAETVLELYCGNGNFTFTLAGSARSVEAVEESSVALGLARASAEHAGVKNVRFVQGEVRRVAQGLLAERRGFDALLLDPPRGGAPGVGGWAAGLGVRRVVYVSCEPTSLARDSAELRRHGFEARCLQVVDMFPQTHHVEAVMAFTRTGE